MPERTKWLVQGVKSGRENLERRLENLGTAVQGLMGLWRPDV